MSLQKHILFILLNLCFSMLYAQNPETNFEDYKKYFFEKYWELNPASATYQGVDGYAHLLPIIDPTTVQNSIDKYQSLHQLLKKHSPNTLKTSDRIDYFLLDNQIQSKIWHLKYYRAYEWNPSIYNISGQFHKILKDDLTTAEKTQAIYSKLLQVPAYYEAAKKNLQKPTVEHTDLAIQRLKGGLDFYEKDIPQLMEEYMDLKKIKGKISKKKLRNAHEAALLSVQSFVQWLENDLRPSLDNPKKKRSFRLGKDLYSKKFAFDIQSDYSAQKVYEKGMRDKALIHLEMKKITQQLWGKYFGDSLEHATLAHVKQLIDKIAEKHVKRDEFVDAIRQQIPELEAFVKEKDLIYLDPKKPLEVRATPAYMRGIAGASISAPGPFEKDRPTYYNVTPLDHYTEEEAESYLKEYNHYILQILNIHEAVPGHYTQLVYANKAPSLVKSIFGNGTMIEGWACYVERMMLEEGYGNHEPEMWLMYYKWNLREICNALIDIGVHTQKMTKKEVMNLLVKEAFQESTEAEGKWRRVTLTQVQLCSYYTGLTEIYELREAWKKVKKDKYDLKLFHTQFLGYGSAPVKHIKTMMYQDYLD